MCQLRQYRKLSQAATAIRDTLVLAKSPRLITALAPVLVQNIDAINLHQVNAELAQGGLQRRFGWLIDNTARRRHARAAECSASLGAKYRGAEVILGNFLGLAYSELRVPEDPKLRFDVLDRNIRSQRTLEGYRGVIAHVEALADRDQHSAGRLRDGIEGRA